VSDQGLARIIDATRATYDTVDRGVTLEEQRHQRECFILCSALGTMFDLCAADLKGNSPLASSRQNCIALVPEGLHLESNFTANNLV
jgi:hypothetical protein